MATPYTEAAQRRLRKEILSHRMPTCPHPLSGMPMVYDCNILLVGPPGVGKSSLANSIYTAMHGRGNVSLISPAGAGGHVTQSFEKIGLPLSKFDKDRLMNVLNVPGVTQDTYIPFNLADLKGIQLVPGNNVVNAMSDILDGRVASGTAINQNWLNVPALNRNPIESDKMHVIIFVAAADNLANFQTMLQQLMPTITAKKIPCCVALTMVDVVDGNLRDHPEAIHNNEVLAPLVQQVSGLGFRICDVFPVQPYGANAMLVPGDPVVEVPILNLLWHALGLAEDAATVKTPRDPTV